MNKHLKKIQRDITPFLVNKFRNYFAFEYGYIECPEDLDDLEMAVCDEELEEETFNEAITILMESEEAYDIEICNSNEINKLKEDIYGIIEDVFMKVKEDELEIWREKFDMEDMVTEMEEYEDW